MKEEARKVEKLFVTIAWLSKEEYENIHTKGGRKGRGRTEREVEET